MIIFIIKMFVTRGITFIFSHNYEKSMKRQSTSGATSVNA